MKRSVPIVGLCVFLLFSFCLQQTSASGGGKSSAKGSKWSANDYRSSKKDSKPLRIVIDREKYALGHAIFLGKTPLADTIISADSVKSQAMEFEALKRDMPKKIRREMDLDHFAGRLSEQQFIHLKYFLFVRFVHYGSEK